MEIVIARLNHRRDRDKRITTHACLVARAFGAKKIIIFGEKDESIRRSIENVNEKWGRGIEIEFMNSVKKFLNEIKISYKIIHLTMYGVALTKKIEEIRKEKRIVIVIGGKKVPRFVYEVAHYNVSITNQPHSEIAALAVFLHEYMKGKEFKLQFNGAKIKILPSERGKIIQKL